MLRLLALLLLTFVSTSTLSDALFVTSVPTAPPPPDPPPATTELGIAAASMSAGEWMDFSTNDLHSTIAYTGGSSGHKLTFFTQGSGWYPDRGEAILVGGDHNDDEGYTVMRYVDATNSWSRRWSEGIQTQNHGHQYNAADTENNRHHYWLAEQYWDLEAEQWVAMPASTAPGGRANQAFSYWSSHGVIQAAYGGVWFLPQDLSAWQTIYDVGTLNFGTGGDTSSLSPFAVYNPVHNLTWFGGGDGVPRSWRLDYDAVTGWSNTQMLNSDTNGGPAQLTGHDGPTGSGVYNDFVVDPISGNFLVLEEGLSPPGTIKLWEYDIITDTWAEMTGQRAPPFSGNLDRVVSFPVNQYGIVVYLEWISNQPDVSKMWLYKHADTPAGNWFARSRGADVVRAVKMTENERVAGQLVYGSAFDNNTTYDAGEQAIKMHTPAAGWSDGERSPEWRYNFSDDWSVQFGEGDSFYVQWRQKFDANHINTVYPGGGDWKQIIIGEGDASSGPPANQTDQATSCTQLEIVASAIELGGIAYNAPGMYHSCDQKDSQYEPFECDAGGGVVFKQPLPSSSCPQQCDWNGGNGPLGDCRGLYVADEWMHFQIGVDIGTWYLNDGNYNEDSRVRLWVGREGQPSELVLDQDLYDIANTQGGSGSNKYGKLWLLNYDTGASANGTPSNTWYKEVIVSTSKIPDPE